MALGASESAASAAAAAGARDGGARKPGCERHGAAELRAEGAVVISGALAGERTFARRERRCAARWRCRRR